MSQKQHKSIVMYEAESRWKESLLGDICLLNLHILCNWNKNFKEMAQIQIFESNVMSALRWALCVTYCVCLQRNSLLWNRKSRKWYTGLNTQSRSSMLLNHQLSKILEGTWRSQMCKHDVAVVYTGKNLKSVKCILLICLKYSCGTHILPKLITKWDAKLYVSV